MENRPDLDEKMISRSLKNWAAERPIPPGRRDRLLAAAALETQLPASPQPPELPLEPDLENPHPPVPTAGVPWSIWSFLLKQQLTGYLVKWFKLPHQPAPGFASANGWILGPYTQTRAWSLRVTEILHQVT